MKWWQIESKASDWCSFWPDHWITYDYSACCEQHDKDYEDDTVSRWDADVALMQCVCKQCKPVMAVIMFLGVRCFGWMFKHYVTPKKEGVQ
jgi:hypothetical protein